MVDNTHTTQFPFRYVGGKPEKIPWMKEVTIQTRLYMSTTGNRTRNLRDVWRCGDPVHHLHRTTWRCGDPLRYVTHAYICLYKSIPSLKTINKIMIKIRFTDTIRTLPQI